MKKLFKWTGIIIGAVFVLLILIGIISGLTGNSAKQPPQSATAIEAPTTSSSPTPAPTATSKPAPKPTATPSVPTVGQALQLANGLLFMVESVATQGGLTFVTVLLDNSLGTKTVAVSSLMSFSLKDSEGNVAEIDIFADRPSKAPEGQILAGDKLRGTLAYETDTLKGVPLFYFRPDLVSSAVRITLQ